ncbi:DMT family transporter [Bacillus mojavensis]|uniref:DMT family transporter n=1 Tax=Bacillus mojavensis TaxID=72360 RepID=UPI002DB88DF4|nr:DMT family transporter [Bacillus mojavensis]MEC1292508.1 DMT family transporter [Bacillus mojavensis]MEC1703305.1 DMT family transporter [Bacillus mojavensis]MEC5247999.1 DMT family transporter [Bacillus mojavensis]
MNQLRVVSMIAIISLIWGYLWVTVKIGLQDFPPFLFSSLRLFIGAAVLFIVLIVQRENFMPKKSEWKPFFILAVLMCIGYYALSTFGMQFVDSGVSSVLVYTMPIIISLMAHYLLDERLTINKGIGLIIGAMGLIFIVGTQIFHLSFNSTLLGEAIILVSAFFWACANIYTKKIGGTHHKIKMTMWQMLIGAILILIISITSEYNEIRELSVSTPSILALLYNGILGSAVAFVGWNWVLGKIDASIASISLMSVPLLGLFFGWLQLGEEITSNILIGAILVCIGIVLTSIKIKKTTKTKTTSAA